jgi:hypothetical protein
VYICRCISYWTIRLYTQYSGSAATASLEAVLKPHREACPELGFQSVRLDDSARKWPNNVKISAKMAP